MLEMPIVQVQLKLVERVDKREIDLRLKTSLQHPAWQTQNIGPLAYFF